MFSCKIFYLLPPWLLSLVIYFVFSNHQSVQLHSHVQLFVTPWTAARQASLYYQLKLMSTESVMPSDHVILCHPLLLPSGGRLMEHPASGSFPMSQFFKSGGQSIRVSASASVLPMNIQDWFPLEWTGWISLQSKGTTESLGLSRVFSNTTVQRHQFFSTQLSLQSSFHIHNWVLFLLWLCLFILSAVISPPISSSILGTYQPGAFIFQCPIFLPFYTIHGILKARILKWFAIPFSSGPCFVRTLCHDPSFWVALHGMDHSFIELDKAVVCFKWLYFLNSFNFWQENWLWTHLDLGLNPSSMAY